MSETKPKTYQELLTENKTLKERIKEVQQEIEHLQAAIDLQSEPTSMDRMKNW